MNRHPLRSRRSQAGITFAALAAGVLGVTVAAQQPALSALNTRMVVLLFDLGSLQPEDLGLAAAHAIRFVDETMASADSVAVATIGTRLNVVTDFTSDHAVLKTALGSLTPEAGAASADTGVRLRAIRTLCETLAPIHQKKAVLYFSTGMPRSGDNDQAALREATNTCNRGNTSIYPVDARGLQALVAGGGATTRARDAGLFR